MPQSTDSGPNLYHNDDLYGGLYVFWPGAGGTDHPERADFSGFTFADVSAVWNRAADQYPFHHTAAPAAF